MTTSISNIRSAYNDARRFANTSSNNGLVEFTHAVRGIAHDYYNEIQIVSANGKNAIYKFIQEKMNEKGWNGYNFTK